MHNEVLIRDAAAGLWLHFRHPVEVIETDRLDEVLPCLRRVESLVGQKRLYGAGFLSYEAAPAFDQALAVRRPTGFPLLWFGVYQNREAKMLEHPVAPDALPPTGWLPSITQTDYNAAVAELRERIARGETYQVNYTFRLRSPWTADAWQFFLGLVEAQHPPYGAYVDTPRFTLCSASPELFFWLDGDTIVSRPMKGTCPRGRWYAEDAAGARWLAQSEKNRAENAMIVDMMRNDLGKIARVGSVRVRDLFRVERYPTVWQMTSTVEAQTSAPVSEILAALFPCASVTGAPKPSTMRIIARAETAPRGVYTGAIGWMAPGRRAQFNVAIRTAVIDKAAREAEYGTGGGVVWDSTPDGEHRECLLKARILAERRPNFSLLETMLWRGASGVSLQVGERGATSRLADREADLDSAGKVKTCPTALDDYFLLDDHLRRLGESAEYFGIPLDKEQLRRRLAELAASLPSCNHKVRLLVSQTGDVSCEAVPLEDRRTAVPVRLELAARPVDSADPFLYHKTTHREVYEAARRGCTRGEDVLLYNQRGEITETCISNVVVRKGDEFWTPPVECGLLPGTFRSRLLAEGKLRQRPIPLILLGEIDELLLINSVREWRRAVLLDRPFDAKSR